MSPRADSRITPIDWADVHRRMEQADAAIQDALHPTAARARAIMDARARALAQTAAPRTARNETLDVVLFKLGNERYAVEARYVREVLRFADYTPVPGAPDVFVGVTNFRGSVLAVVDLRVLFNIAQKGLTDLSRVLVLGTDRAEFGVVVDVADSQAGLSVSDVLAPSDAIRIEHTYVRGVTRDALIVLNGDMLLQDERLYINNR